ncbi:murein biosynthesis integral membrane protein MurJ [Benzoatithermus flavus]|uniref:Probable lipid II flippase MurJ n=1 Tax=Benzoatithermus flavus TaxID=3108223 RepID=A0ABU8XV66_9PROT
MSIGRATATVGGLTALSRVAGFARDLLIAAALGAGPVADAFFVSLKLANLLRRLFAEGAFNAAFVPLYSRLGEGEGGTRARRFAGEVMAALTLALLVVVLLGELTMPWLVRLLASGFPPQSLQYRLAVELGRLTFPYLLFISLAALVGGVLQAGHRFAAASFAPVLLNLVLIAILLVSLAEGEAAARLLAAGVTLAGLVQLAWVGLAAARAGMVPLPALPRLSPEMRRLLVLTAPGILGIGIVQLNLLLGSWFATHLAAGTVAYLFYADRLVQLPLGIVGVALGTALLPTLSRAVRQGEAAHDVLNRAIELALLLGLPAAAGLFLLAEPIITVLFQRGAFGPEAARATGQVLAGLALGIPAHVLGKVLAPGFYASEDTRTPVRIAAMALVVNGAAAALLIGPLAHVGVALAIALSSWANALGLAWLLWRKRVLVPDAGLRRRGGAILAAAAAMAAVLALGRSLGHTGAGPVALASLIALGGGSFFLAAWAAGAIDATALRRLWVRPALDGGVDPVP